MRNNTMNSRPEYRIRSMRLEHVNIKERIRPMREDKVADLVESIRRVGLLQPIVVLETDDWFDLVSGRHRYAACKALGWEFIDCVVLKCDAVDARLSEIAENLHRSELTVLERSEHVAEWARLAGVSGKVGQKLDEAKPVQLAQVSGGRGKEGGESAAARELGLDRFQVRRSIAIDKLTDDAKAAAVEMGVDDNQSALLEAAKAPPERQAEVLRARSPQIDQKAAERDRTERWFAEQLIDLPAERHAQLAEALATNPSIKAIAAHFADWRK
jgi:ParB-like chromosome segregation protein Spo0J